MAVYFVTTSGNNGNNGLSEISGFRDPGYAAPLMGDGDICYVRTGTYTISNTTTGAGGPIKFGQTILRARMEGYSSVTGDMCSGVSKPLIIASGGLTPTGAFNIVEGAGTNNEPHVFVALRVDGNNRPNTTCFKGTSTSSAYNSHFYNCEAVRAASDGFNSANCVQCFASGNSGEGFDTVVPFFCLSVNNSGAGITALSEIVHCAAIGNGSGGINAAFSINAINCLAYGNTSWGINGSRNNMFINCVSVNNSDDGFETLDHTMLINCADYNNGQGRFATAPHFDFNPITLSTNPFTDPANYNFLPNTTAGGGALLREAGINLYGYTGFLNIGPVQHQNTITGSIGSVSNNVIDPLTHSVPGI